MAYEEIARAVDHAVLSPTATWAEIRQALDDGVKYQVASVCIPPVYVGQARDYVGEAVVIGTVAGYPNGYTSTAAKVFEIRTALEQGAGEVDAVLQLGWLKEGRYDRVLEELQRLREAAGEAVLKVIVETSLLSGREKQVACELAAQAGADFLRTSSGFASGGATAQDILLFSQYLGPDMGIKAAGGISSLDDARHFLDLGATRLGSSRIVGILRSLDRDRPGR